MFKIPAKLKTAGDISRFATRSAQLEKVKPVIAYWCEYYIVQQILSKGLHTADQECKEYTSHLMDKLEQIKAEHSTEDAILDDVAAHAYCEQFALEVFQNADNAVRANKASVQTADTFRAAATFLDLLNIWGPPEQEILAKSKFAKYHALRIAKALKAGEDPNLSNPVQEAPPPATSPPVLDPNDPEVQRINGAPYQPYVESAPDTSAHPSPAISATRISPPPPTLPSAPTGYTTHSSSTPQYFPHRDISPISPPSTSRQGSVSSAGGGYFPRVNIPTFTSDAGTPSLPTAPSIDDEAMTSPYEPAAPPPEAQNFYQNQTRDVDQNKLAFPHPQPQALPQQAPQHQLPPPQNIYQNQHQYTPPPPQQPPQQQQYQQYQTQQPHPPATPAQYQTPMPQQHDQPMSGMGTGRPAYHTDEDAILAAQKHAKWAVSALNFEDVETAVKELRIALRSLGAS
ncbi:DUF605-domain-containing protein [Lepidopterella palustris CBS 459.81]|uniref:DUF605-domain-containing protein n=1 Tax=Lepidopterella palustris CBS 459.81 TaxID=1314670 RepID=A0A8E2EJ37_9PEZI|nr:DUF605-domain-containing protein [Lepidopterella palustris CBS 459.81]